MSDPLYKVGERVGLVSKSMPQHNGEYIVERILAPNEMYVSRNDGSTLLSDDNNYTYLLDKVFLCERVGYGEICWKESALRKLHKPSKYSFDELLSEIKSCNMDTIEA
jgi:hypothetical protein